MGASPWLPGVYLTEMVDAEGLTRHQGLGLYCVIRDGKPDCGYSMFTVFTLDLPRKLTSSMYISLLMMIFPAFVVLMLICMLLSSFLNNKKDSDGSALRWKAKLPWWSGWIFFLSFAITWIFAFALVLFLLHACLFCLKRRRWYKDIPRRGAEPLESNVISSDYFTRNVLPVLSSRGPEDPSNRQAVALRNLRRHSHTSSTRSD